MFGKLSIIDLAAKGEKPLPFEWSFQTQTGLVCLPGTKYKFKPRAD